MDSHYGDVIYLANQFQFSPYYAECTSANAAVAMLAERIATQSFIPKQSGPWITTIPPNATLPACRLHVTGATQGARSIGVQVSTFSQDDLEARALSAAIGEYLIRYDDREVMLTSDVGAFHVRSYGFQNKEGTEEVTAEGEVLYHAFVSYDLDWV